MKKEIFIITAFILINSCYAQNILNLKWENKKNSKTEENTWIYAKKYCKNLEVRNKKEWRLPTYLELQKYGSIKNINNDIKNDYYWSSDTNPEDIEEAQIYDILTQAGCDGLKNEDFYNIICVQED